MAAAIALFLFVYFVYGMLADTSSDRAEQEMTIEVAPGEGVATVGEKLDRADVIDSLVVFKLYAWLSGKGKRIQPGEYRVNSDMTFEEIMNGMTEGSGSFRETDVIKIAEGSRLVDVADYLEGKDLAAAEEFLDMAGRPKREYDPEENESWPPEFFRFYDFLESKPERYGLEGYLFPDTYEVYTDTSPQDIIIKMLDNFDSKLTPEIRRDIREQGRTVHEIVTMASLLEKEVRTEEEMKIAAGIFWKRIEQDRPLQSCATLAYAMGEDKVRYSRLDTEIESPYNTYKYKGLPPTPVSNPGLTAIKAAVYPQETEYNYFLSPAGSDITVFSKTAGEHERNKRKYLD